MDDYIQEDFSPENFEDEAEIIDDADEDDVVVEKAPDGGLRAWLIVLSCFCINLVVQAMTSLIDLSKMDSNMTKELNLTATEIQEAITYFKGLSDLFAPFALLVMIKFGYKVTVVVGSLIICFSFTNMSMLGGGGSERSIGGYWQFWLCGPAAIGLNFLKLGALIPVLEYFTEKRMKALVLSRLGTSLGSMATIGLMFAKNLKWRTIFRINAGLCILSLAIAFTLRNIGITYKNKEDKPKKESIWKRIVDMFNIPLFKLRTFWIIMGVFFFFKFGLTPVSNTIPTATGKVSGAPSGSVGLFAPAIASTFGTVGGMGTAFLFKRLKFLKRFSKQSLMFVLTMVAVSGPVVGIFSVITVNSFGFFVFFSLIVMVFQALSENVRDESIPTVFKRKNIRITESFLNMFVGFASMIAGAIQHGVDKADDDYGWKVNLKLGGSFLIITGLVTATLIILHKLGKFKLKEKSSAGQTSAPAKPNETEQSDDQLPNDIDEISMTKVSGKIQSTDDYRKVDQQALPMGQSYTNQRQERVSSDERMQDGMPRKTRHLSVGNFTANANNQMHPDARMNRSYSASDNQQIYENYPHHSFQQQMQGPYSFQGSNHAMQRNPPFQGSSQHMQEPYPFQGNNNNMQRNDPFQGNSQNKQGNPGKVRGQSKHGQDKKRGSSQNNPFQGRRQPIPSNDPNKRQGMPDDYFTGQLTEAGTVLY